MRAMIHILFFLFSISAYSPAQNWQTLSSGTDNAVRCLFADTVLNELYVGGNFKYAGGIVVNGIAKWDGEKWDSLGSGVSDCWNFCFPVLTITKYKGELYAGGLFKIMGGKNVNGLAKWNGTQWDSLFGAGGGNVIKLYPFNGDLYVCGGFNYVGGVHASNIAKWNGAQWSPVANDTIWNGTINAMAFYNGELYIGGNFYNITTGLWRLAKWNGTNWVKVGNSGIYGGMDDPVDMVIYNNELYVAGTFKAASGNVGNYIQKWNGIEWSDVGGGVAGYFNNPANNGQIQDLEVHNSKLYTAGVFQYAGGVPAEYIAVWDGAEWCGLGSDFDNIALAIGFYKDTLYVGGGFWTIDADTILSIAKWTGGNYVDTCGVIIGQSEIPNPKSEILIFPNPNTGEFFCELNIASQKDITIRLYNSIGQVIYKNIFKSGIDRKIHLNIPHLSDGIYLVMLTQADKVEIIRMAVIK